MSVQPKALRGLWSVIDPDGNPVFTHLGTKKDEAIEFFLEEERSLRRFIRNERAPSWEVFEADGYTAQQMDLIPAIDPLLCAAHQPPTAKREGGK